jgi:hypothetical protein
MICRSLAFDACFKIADVLPDASMVYTFERLPWIERSLYLLLGASIIRAADRRRTLRAAIFEPNYDKCRLHGARKLTKTSPMLRGVPKAAVNRFFELLQALPQTAGIRYPFTVNTPI